MRTIKKPLRQIVKSPNHQIASVCFVTGTDTGIGKTVVTAALARNLRNRDTTVCAMKPVEASCHTDDHSDAVRLRAAARCAEPLRAIRLYQFTAPVAPLEAARMAGAAISIPVIVAAARGMARRYGVVLLEGAGGVRVPLSSNAEVRDLIVQLRCPVIVVGRTSLGTVNHTLLTLESLRQAGVKVLAVILNRSSPRRVSLEKVRQEQSTVRLLKEWCAVPVLGPLPYLHGLNGSWERGLTQLARHPAIRDLANLIVGNRRRRLPRFSSRRRPVRSRK